MSLVIMLTVTQDSSGAICFAQLTEISTGKKPRDYLKGEICSITEGLKTPEEKRLAVLNHHINLGFRLVTSDSYQFSGDMRKFDYYLTR